MRAKSGAVTETHASSSPAIQQIQTFSFARHADRQMAHTVDRRRPKHRCVPVLSIKGQHQHSTAIRQERSPSQAQKLSALGVLGSLSASFDLWPCPAVMWDSPGLLCWAY